MPSTTSKNLGQVAAVISGATAPANTNVVWLDTSGVTTIKKIFNPSTSQWEPLTQTGTVAGDNWGTQVVVHDVELDGDGTTGNPLILAQQGATTGQVLKWDGAKYSPADDDTGTGIANVAHNTELAGDGTVGDPLKFAQQSATTGQVLKWNGTQWAPAADEIGVQFSTGMIMMWCGSIGTIPGGWVLCNGQGNLSTGQPVPNLSGMFIAGYNVNDADYNIIGKTGGLKINQLTSAQNGPHTHGVNDPGHQHNLPADHSGFNNIQSLVDTANSDEGYTGGSPTSPATTGITLQTSGLGDPIENRPPYYTLAYIVKL